MTRRPTLPFPPLMVITDRHAVSGSLTDLAAGVFGAGCRWMMLREKDLSTEALTALAAAIATAARPFGATVLINGNAEAARLSGADGVQLPQGQSVSDARALLGDRALIGVSAHNLAEAEAAARDGADYVTVSPVFASISKPGYGPSFGPDSLARLTRGIDIPVVALGGITEDNAADCLSAGARGVAAMGAVMRANDPGKAVRGLIATIEQSKPFAKKWDSMGVG